MTVIKVNKADHGETVILRKIHNIKWKSKDTHEEQRAYSNTYIYIHILNLPGPILLL